MKIRPLFILASMLILFAGCAKEAAVKQPATEAANPPSSPEASATAGAMAGSTATSTAASTAIKSGVFVAAEAPTEGTVRLVTENTERYLELDQNFKTSDKGPDLVVILHRSDNLLGSTKPPSYPLKAEDYVILGPLQKTAGGQRYAIPANVNLEDYQSAAIWCRQFNATFGVAKFES
jgi:hypothetical protein